MTVVINDVDEIVRAVRGIYDISTSNAERLHFTQVIELLKDGPTDSCIPTAFRLISSQESVVSLVGWNVIEHVVKYRWHDISHDEKLSVRSGVLCSLMNAADMELNLKVCVSRVVVSMMEHEWPQNWPELLPSFIEISKNPENVLQCQIVFLILKRLIEDTFTLVVIEDPTRKKELQAAVNSGIDDILQMCISRLQICFANVQDIQTASLTRYIIELLSEISDWISGKVLTKYVEAIVDILCMYLSVETCYVYEAATRCLVVLASRKRVKTDEPPIVFALFRDKTLQTILSACSNAALSSNASEEHYSFLKSLCDLVCSLGVHLSDIWGHIKEPPENFGLYIDVLGQFFQHPSMYLRLESADVLIALSSNSTIRGSITLLQKMPHILTILPKSMDKHCWNADEMAYCKMDYESEENFVHDFTKLRDRCSRIIRENCVSHSSVIMSIISNWVTELCSTSLATSNCDSMKRYISVYIQSALQYNVLHRDAVVMLMDLLLNRANEETDPVKLNECLSIISAFFLVFQHATERIPVVLVLLNKLIMIPIDSTDVQCVNRLSLRRHCINLLLKLVTSLSNSVRPFADQILSIVISTARVVSPLQRVNLIQVVAALSNSIENPENQAAFLLPLVQEVLNFFNGDEFLTLSNPQEFLSAVNANSPFNATSNDVYHEVRLRLKSQLMAFEGVLSQLSPCKDRASPLFEAFSPAIRRIFSFVECVNSLCDQAVFTGSADSVLPTTSDVSEQMLTRCESAEDDIQTKALDGDVSVVQRFITEMTEVVQNCIGLVCSKFPYDFYKMPDASELVKKAFSGAEKIPRHRLRQWIKRAWARLICCCPITDVSVIIPIMCALSGHMNSVLSSMWSEIERIDQDEGVTDEELFAKQTASLLSRDYSNFLSQLIIDPEILEEKRFTDKLSPLAGEILKDRSALEATISSLFIMLNCPDSKVVLKLIPSARVVIATYNGSIDEQNAGKIFVECVKSLALNGADETCCNPLLGLCFLTYCAFRHKYPSLVEILRQVPDCTEENIQSFDSRAASFSQNTGTMTEKMKRDAMRKMLKAVISPSMGQKFRRPPQLRPINRRPQTTANM